MADTKQYPVDVPGVPPEFTVQLDDHDAKAFGHIKADEPEPADDDGDDPDEKATTSTANKGRRTAPNKTATTK